MKIRYLFLLLFIPIIYTACKKEDVDNTNSNNTSDNTSSSIIGGWQANTVELTTTRGYYDNYPNGKVVVETETDTWTNNNQLFEILYWYADFKENGECIVTKIESDGEVEIDTTNYLKQSSILIFTDDAGDLFEEEQVHNIETLNNYTLILYVNELDTGLSSGTNPNQDVVYFTEYEMDYTFDRDN